MGGSSSQTVNVGSRSVSRRQQSSVERIPNDNVGDSKEQPLRRRPRIVPFSDQLDEVVINSGRAKFFEDDPQKSTIKNLQEISDQSAIFLLDLAMKHLGVDDVWIKANFSKVVLPSLKQIFLPEDEVLFAEGDRGTYLYIIEQGAISVIQDEVEVDVLTNGAILGLESLKFGFPRSFTARSLERCRLWSLNRKNYAALVQEISSPKLSVNARRFLEVPEVAALPSVYIEKLMQNLSSSTYENNQDIFTAGRCCSKVMVIESGHVDVHFPENMLDLSEDEFIHKLGIHVDLAGIFTPTGSPLSWGYVLGRGDSIPAAPAGSPGANRSSSVVPPSRSGSGSGPVADVTPRATKSCATTPVMGTGRKKFHEPSTISAAAIQELEAQPKSDATDALTPISRAAPRKSSVTAIASKMGLYDEVRESRTQPGATGTKSETGDSGSAVAAAQSQSAASSISLPLSNLMRSPMGSVSAHNTSQSASVKSPRILLDSLSHHEGLKRLNALGMGSDVITAAGMMAASVSAKAPMGLYDDVHGSVEARSKNGVSSSTAASGPNAPPLNRAHSTMSASVDGHSSVSRRSSGIGRSKGSSILPPLSEMGAPSLPRRQSNVTAASGASVKTNGKASGKHKSHENEAGKGGIMGKAAAAASAAVNAVTNAVASTFASSTKSDSSNKVTEDPAEEPVLVEIHIETEPCKGTDNQHTSGGGNIDISSGGTNGVGSESAHSHTEEKMTRRSGDAEMKDSVLAAMRDTHHHHHHHSHGSRGKVEKVLRLGKGSVLGFHVFASLLRVTGAPIWRDEILDGTPNVGAESAVTIKAHGRVQVSYLTSFNFESVFGRSSSSLSLYESREMAEYFDELDLSTGKGEKLGYVRRQKPFLTSKPNGIKSDLSMENLSELERVQDTPLGTVELATLSIPNHTVTSSTTSILRRSFTELANILENEINGKVPALNSSNSSHGASPSNQTVCILKKFSKSKVVAENQLNNVLIEAKILSDVSYQHPFIVKMLGKLQTPTSLVMAMERVGGGDLWSILYEKSFLRVAPREIRHRDRTLGTGEEQLALPLVKFYAACVVAALSHLHAHNIVYRNLKPENILIDDRGYIRLIGFGLAKKLPYHDTNGILQSKAFTVCGTVEYMAPEIIALTGHNVAVDAWAFGVLLCEMISGRTPFLSHGLESKVVEGNIVPFRIQHSDATILAAIAETQTKGLQLPRECADEIAAVPGAKDLIHHLLDPIQNTRAKMSLKPSSVIARSSLFIGMDWHKLQSFAMTSPYVPPRAADPVRARRTTMTNTPEAESKPSAAPAIRPSLVSVMAGKPSYLESTTASRMNTILAPILRSSRCRDDLQKLVDMAAPAIAALEEYKGDQSIFTEF